MNARLFSKTGETRGTELELREEATVGRDPESSLVIDRPLMSSRHARLAFDANAGRYVVEDLGSLNGTELDGDRIRGPQRLGHLHVITFAGNYDFIFQDLELCARRLAARPDAQLPAEGEPAAGKPKESREVTAVEEEAVALPSFLAERAEDVRQGAGAGPEVTSIEHDAVALPSFLAERAEDVRQKGSGVRETTSVEEDAVALPGFLAQRAEEVRDDGHEAHEQASAGEGTRIEKLPVAVPDLLARRAAETIDTRDKAKQDDLAAAVDDLLVARPASGVRLIVMGLGDQVRQFELEEGENLVGRGADAQVLLDSRDLSRRHANLAVAGGKVTVCDLGSRNRTFLDGEAIAPQTEIEVPPDAKLRFGSVEARLSRRSDD